MSENRPKELDHNRLRGRSCSPTEARMCLARHPYRRSAQKPTTGSTSGAGVDYRPICETTDVQYRSFELGPLQQIRGGEEQIDVLSFFPAYRQQRCPAPGCRRPGVLLAHHLRTGLDAALRPQPRRRWRLHPWNCPSRFSVWARPVCPASSTVVRPPHVVANHEFLPGAVGPTRLRMNGRGISWSTAQTARRSRSRGCIHAHSRSRKSPSERRFEFDKHPP